MNMINERSDARGGFVRSRHIGIASDVESIPIVMGEHRLDEQADNVIAEVGRDVSDSRLSLPLAARRNCKTRQSVIPPLMLGHDFIQSVIRAEPQVVEQRA